MLKRRPLNASEPSGPILGLVAIFVVSLVVGLLVGGIWSRFDQKGIAEDDFIVMVSLIYGRDGDLLGAQERLALLQKDDIGKRVVAVADEYPGSHPDAKSEARALSQLANALDWPGEASRSSNVDVSPPDGEPFSLWMWLGIALIVICVLGIGGPLALRLVHATRQGLSGAKIARPKHRAASTKWKDSPAGATPTNSSSADQEANFAAPATPPTRASTTNPFTRLQRITNTEKQPTVRFPSSRWNGTTATFASRYRHGMDPYDEVHPIINPVSGELIGACGMSALLKLPDSVDARYYAVSIWAQDYISDEPLRCTGLVSSYCKAHPPIDLMRWAQSRVADEIVVANPGLKLGLDTTNLKVGVSVLGLRYGIDVRGPEDGYFSELEVSFQVQVMSGALPERSLV